MATQPQDLELPAKNALHPITMAIALLGASMPGHAIDYHRTSGAYSPGVTAPDPLLAPDTLILSTAAARSFTSIAWTNAATVNHQGGTISGGSATLTNTGLWDFQDDTGGFAYTVGSQPTFLHTGTLRKSAGALTQFGSWAFVSNGGAVEALSGVLEFNGSGVQINQGFTFAGAGMARISGGAAFSGNFGADNLTLSGGTFSGSAARLAGGVGGAGAASWTGGSLTDSWEVGTGTTWTGATGGNKQLAEVTLVNAGTIAWETTDDLLGGSSALTNDGLFEARADSRMVYNIGGQPTFTNRGTLRATAGVTFANQGFNLVNDGGTLEVLAGGAIVYDGNSNRFNDGTVFAGAGRNIVNSNARFVDGFQSGNLLLQAGVFTGGDGTPGSKAVANGSTGWTGGQVSGTWELANGHVLTGQDGGSKQLASFDLHNRGTIHWQTEQALFAGSGTVTNDGRIEIASDADIVYNVGSQPVFVNHGVFVKSAGDGETSLASLNLTNAGTMDVRSGTMRLPSDFANNGTLTGTGTFATSTLTNAGTVAPGASPGTLSIAGNFVQAASCVFAVDIGTLLSSDLLLVSGTAALDGTLALHCFGACSLAVGDELVILDSVGNLGGSFAGGITMTGFATGKFDVIYETVADQMRLQVTETVAAIPEPGTWLMILLGLGAVGRLALRPRQPG